MTNDQSAAVTWANIWEILDDFSFSIDSSSNILKILFAFELKVSQNCQTAISSLIWIDNLELTPVYKLKATFPQEHYFVFINFEFHYFYCTAPSLFILKQHFMFRILSTACKASSVGFQVFAFSIHSSSLRSCYCMPRSKPHSNSSFFFSFLISSHFFFSYSKQLLGIINIIIFILSSLEV